MLTSNAATHSYPVQCTELSSCGSAICADQPSGILVGLEEAPETLTFQTSNRGWDDLYFAFYSCVLQF